MKFETRLIGRELCGELLTARFDRPEGYDFRAGQYLSLGLPRAGEVLSRPLSHASSPADGHIEIATHLSASSFKRVLAGLEIGDVVQIVGPAGRLALPPDPGEVVYLAGGIGITPVRSLLRDLGDRGVPVRGWLFFGNREMECAPYLGEMLDLASASDLQVVNVLERPHEGWTGESGLITAEILKSNARLEDASLFVTTGPPAMVSAMEDVLDGLGVDTDKRLVERFGGRS